MRPPPPQGASAHDISTLPTRKWQRPAPTSPTAAVDSDRNKLRVALKCIACLCLQCHVSSRFLRASPLL